jgi:pyridoxal phosphate enzyme (YggS family)
VIAAKLERVREEIRSACMRSSRSPEQCALIAVSKTFSTNDISDAVLEGQMIFGESRLQEAEPKITALPKTLEWHFIGRLQSNKLRKILQLFKVLHSIDSLRIACIADKVAAELGLRPQVFLQVNLAREITKGGFDQDSLYSDFEALLALKNLNFAGLMTIHPPCDNPEAARPWFVKLRDLRYRLETGFGTKLPGLSMGMSGDFDVAIEEGATHIRVGSAIFGDRSRHVHQNVKAP